MPQVTQATLNRMARTVQTLLPVRWETVVYRSRVTASGSTTDHAGLSVAFEEYSAHTIAMQGLIGGDRSTMVLREDRRIRIATADVTWTPTLYDEVLRVNGEHWRVMDVQGGPGSPFWQLRGRRGMSS